MKNKISNDVYKEVYYPITENDKLLQNIPSKFLTYIRRKAKESNEKFDFLKSEETISQLSVEALALYVYLYLKYGNVTDIQKEKIKNSIIRNSVVNVDAKLNNLEQIFMEEVDNDNLAIIRQVRDEAEEKIKNLIAEDDVGYENELYLIMKEKLNEFGIEWNPFSDGICQ